MRLWSLHPEYLDARGLVALWREALLARKVLSGGTRGYRSHPQLERFNALPDPVAAIDCYLRHIFEEAHLRLPLTTYDILATGPRAGVIACVPDALSLDALRHRPGW